MSTSFRMSFAGGTTRRIGIGGSPRRGFAATLAILAMCGLIGWLSPSAAQAQSASRDPQMDLARTAVTLTTASGEAVFDAQIADTAETRGKGLMFRREMPPREGMLFDFHEERPVSFWMENTPLPLDLIFIKENGEVRHIASGAVPYSRASIPSNGPVRYVLEVNAGVADEIGLAPGDAVSIGGRTD